jgi:FkbM family methyltransferase
MNMIPHAFKPAAHRVMDVLTAVFGLHLPDYYNLTTKTKHLLTGVDEFDIRFVAEQFIKPGECVIDVGANVGLTARTFARAVGPQGRVMAIEPERSNFSFLCANTLRYPCVHPHRIALSASDEIRQLCLNPVSGTGNSFFGNPDGVVQRVQCLTFDEFCAREEIYRIDWIKIDVEGAELEVLGGMEASLQRNPHARILIELCPENLQRAGSSVEMLLGRLRDLGFRTDVISGSGSSLKVETTSDPVKFLEGKAYINLLCTRPWESSSK